MTAKINVAAKLKTMSSSVTLFDICEFSQYNKLLATLTTQNGELRKNHFTLSAINGNIKWTIADCFNPSRNSSAR